MKLNTKIKNLGFLHCTDVHDGDVKLNVMPFVHTACVKLPPTFQRWESTLNEILTKYVPIQEKAKTHYITIDSKFFTLPESQRREGIHIDGNFCADPNFQGSTWGGNGTTWGGKGGVRYNPVTKKAETDWTLPYDVEIPIGDYVSDTKGGIFAVSTQVGCHAWEGRFKGRILDGGDCAEIQPQLIEANKTILEKNCLYFMTSNTPHDSVPINQGIRRTFLRITLNHEYDNRVLR